MKEINANGKKKKRNVFVETTRTNMSRIQRERIAQHSQIPSLDVSSNNPTGKKTIT